MISDCPASCPFVAAPTDALQFPPGQLHHVASVGPGGGSEVDETKRNVLKLLALAGVVAAGGGGLAGGALQYSQPPAVGLSSYPKVPLLDLDGSPLTMKKTLAEYSYLTPDVITFNYPLRNEPNFLLNLAPPPGKTGGPSTVKGGIGPLNSVVAFSAICQHLGCPAPNLAYYPPGTCSGTPGGKPQYLHCACHGSTYDPADGASNLTGPAILPLPQVTLDWNQSDDTISAIGVNGPPVNGHLDTLQGDYPVGTTSQLSKQSPIILCHFPQG